ncbi:hypothetical protein G4Z16_01015 [Streptomyces bathyalis]|uniref:Uncharacterized protein n=1 Tax=Streptomyces bathyalis TaxID=2710756 RepID=A0A7T1WPS4_9ACTN|nr:hypothetical protein [Streptomyces bathyalis]QPP05198.1 hypothetical protein G4Z16_01015 [Streptomyces bathyalis]
MTQGHDLASAVSRMQVQRRQAERREAHYHEARVLLLIAQFTGAKSSLKGLTKLAKLDFLLRYPAMLERLLPEGVASWPADTAPTPPERLAVESRMIRYKYGPWDQRYYRILGALVARGLISYGDGARAEFRTTPRGTAAAASLGATPEWTVTAARIKLLKRHFNKSGSALKELIYDSLPDAVDRPWRTEI